MYVKYCVKQNTKIFTVQNYDKVMSHWNKYRSNVAKCNKGLTNSHNERKLNYPCRPNWLLLKAHPWTRTAQCMLARAAAAADRGQRSGGAGRSSNNYK